jgi:hypothetical protein
MESMYSERSSQNPLQDLISDEVYHLLKSKGLLHETSIRDRQIRLKFKSLRANKLRAGDAIEMIREEYPYLQFETIKKIVHNPPKTGNS